MNYNKLLFIFCMILAGNTFANTETVSNSNLETIKKLIYHNNVSGVQNQLEQSHFTTNELTQLYEFAIQEKDFEQHWFFAITRAAGISTFFILFLITLAKIRNLQQTRPFYIETRQPVEGFELTTHIMDATKWLGCIGIITTDSFSTWTEPDKIIDLLKNKLDTIKQKIELKDEL